MTHPIQPVCPPPATPAAADSLAAPAAARQGAGIFQEFEAWLVTRYDRLDASSKQLLARMEAQEQPIVPMYEEFERVHRQVGELIDVMALLATFKRGEAA